MEGRLTESESSSDEDKTLVKKTPFSNFGSEPAEEKRPSRHRTTECENTEHDSQDCSSKISFQPTKESINGARFAHLYFNPCQEVVRRLMKKMFGQKDEDLKAVLDKNKITNLLPYQREMLDNPSYKTLDFSIMYLIIKSLKAKEIGVDKSLKWWSPFPECTTLYIALERIRLQRNEFAHLPSIEMKLEDFRYGWDIMKSSMLFIADYLHQKDHFEEEVDKLFKAPLSEDNVAFETKRFKELLETVRKQEGLIENVRVILTELLEDINEDNVSTSGQKKVLTELLEETNDNNVSTSEQTNTKQLIQEAKFYVRTPAYAEMLRIILKKRYVVISGRNGDGKSALAYYFLFNLMQKTQVKVNVLSSPYKCEDIKDSWCLNVVFIDNFCSSEGGIQNFIDNSKALERIVNIGDQFFGDSHDDEASVRLLILTARSNHLDKVKDYCIQPSILLARDCIVDMSPQSNPITTDMQTEILYKQFARSPKLKLQYHREHITSFLSAESMFSELPIGFPYVAVQFVKTQAAKMNTKFLTDPFHIFYHELETVLQNDVNLAIFVPLAVCGDNDRKTIDSILSDYKQFLEIKVDQDKIRKMVDLQEYHGTYLQKYSGEETYYITHPSIKQVILLTYIKKFLKLAVKNVEIEYLLNCISICSALEYKNDIKTCYVTTSDEKKIIAECVLCEMRKKCRIQGMLKYDMWQDTEFVEIFVKELEKVDVESRNSVLFQAISSDKVFLVEQILEGLKCKCSSFKLVQCMSDALVLACESKASLKIVKKIIESGANVSCSKDDSQSPISAAVLSNQEEILICLLEHEAIIPEVSEWNYWKLLHSSAKQRDTTLCNISFFSMFLQVSKSPPDNEAFEDKIWRKVSKKSFEVNIEDFFYVCAEFIGIGNALFRAFLDQGLEIKSSRKNGDNIFHIVVMAEVNSVMTDVQISKTVDSFVSHDQFAFLINEKNSAGETPLMMALRLKKAKKVLLSIINGMLKSKVSGNEALEQCIRSEYDDDTVVELVNALHADRLTEINTESAIQMAISQGQYRLKTISALLGETKRLQSSNFKPMHYCINLQLNEHDKIQIIRTLMKQGLEIDEKSSDSKTPLMSAMEQCSGSSLELVNALLSFGAQINMVDNDNNTILHYCFSSNCSDDLVFRFFKETNLLKNIGNPNVQNKDNMTPALLAAQSSKTEAMKELLKVLKNLNVDLTNAHDCDSNTILHLLVVSSRSDKEICSLVKICTTIYPANAHTVNNDGKTPLMLALEVSRKLIQETVPYLLTLQPDMMHKDDSGKSILNYCLDSYLSDECICGILEQDCREYNLAELNILQKVVEHEMFRPNTILFLLSKGNEEYVSNACRLLMLQRRLTPENLCKAKDRLTDKRFHMECSNILKHIIIREHTPEYAKTILNALLENDVEINEASMEGKTPLHLSIVGNKSLEIVEFLLDNGANVNAVDSKGTNALQFCLRSDREEDDMKELFLLLLKRGSDVNGKDRNLRTPLMEAARKGHTSAISILVNEYHANIDERDRAGRTALHYCIEADLPDLKVCSIIEIFMQAPCVDIEKTIEHEDNMGFTLLNTACSCNSRSRVFTILQLLQMKSSVETLDKYGRSPIYNVVLCLDRQDTKSQTERLARLAILQAYKCDPRAANNENYLPKDICEQNDLKDELRMLWLFKSRREMNKLLTASIEIISNEERLIPLYLNEMSNCKIIVNKDAVLDPKMKENIKKTAEILQNLNFNRQDDESQLSDIASP